MIEPNIAAERNKALATLKLTEENLKKLSLVELQKKYEEMRNALNNQLILASNEESKQLLQQLQILNSAFNLLQQEKAPSQHRVVINSGENQTLSYKVVGEKGDIDKEYTHFLAEKYKLLSPEKKKEFKPKAFHEAEEFKKTEDYQKLSPEEKVNIKFKPETFTFNNLEELKASEFYKNGPAELKKDWEEAFTVRGCVAVHVTKLEFNSKEEGKEFIDNMVKKGILEPITLGAGQNLTVNPEESRTPSPFSRSFSRT